MIFSRRCPQLRSQVSLPIRLRSPIYYVLSEHSVWTSESDTTLNEAEYQYKKQLGLEAVWSFDGKPGSERVSSNAEGVIKNGYPSEVLDMIEAFLTVTDNTTRDACEREINQFLKEYTQPWRLIDAQFVKLDSEYLSQEVISTARNLLNIEGFDGAQDEFQHAVDSHSSGDLRTAITSANNALESTIKSVLGMGRARPGELIRALVDSGLIPQYHRGFLAALEQILRSVQLERNEPGRGHGQGLTVADVDPSLAEFCLHLTGTLIVFLIKRHQEKATLQMDDDVDDLPF